MTDCANTTRLTGIVIAGVAEFRNVRTMLLVYVFGDNVFATTLALIVPLALPLVGVTCSQFPPVIGTTDAVNPVVPPEAVIVTVCAAGSVVAPCASLKESEVGDTATVVLDDIVNTTGRVSAPLGRLALFVAEMVIVPV